jgi:hypothetical protein
MSVSIATILGELKEIESRSPEDVAVLMAPLLRALEAVRDGAESQLDHAQAMAMANSLAQTAAQAGDMDAAVAIAAVSAELEQVPPERFTAAPVAAAPPPPAATAAEEPAPPGAHPLANLEQQLLGIVGICALSYAGYLEIQARFQPASVASWVLTGSSSMFALAVALTWHRFVLRGNRGPALTVVALVFAVLAGGWALHTGLTLRPQIVVAHHAAQSMPAASAAQAGEPNAQQASVDLAASADAPSADARREQPPALDTERISFWWLGETPSLPATRMPEQQRDPTDAQETSSAGHAPRDTAASPTPPAAPAMDTATRAADNTAPQARVAGSDASVASAAPAQPQSPLARYRDLLEREVVFTDAKGIRRQGKLTGVSKHGVTVLMELDLFGEPILAQRFYLFDNIENLRAK